MSEELLILFLAVGGINLAIMLIFGWRTIGSVCVFTIVIPVFPVYVFLSKDGLWETAFNFCLQLNIFFILYFISSLTIYLFHISLLTDMFLRLFYFAGLLFFHIRYSRKKFRELAMYITFQNMHDLMLKSQTEQSMKLQITLQKEQYNVVQNKIEADKAFRHDLRHHANLLTGLLRGA